MVSKILRTLPMRYDSKVSTLEERDDLKKVTVDELHGILTAYEMRTGKDKTRRKKQCLKSLPKFNQKI